ncbi:MAG TPA: membrane dipeptidase [Chloroflexota bacterium]|nr:membrane dipeptidase [Chloroflexota bacterium]
MKKTRYSGYTSYSYLEAGRDYPIFKLAKEVDRVPSRAVEVSPEQEARVQRLMQDNVIISLHEHPTVAPENISEIFAYRRQNRDVTGYAGLSISGLDAIFDNLMDGTSLITSHNGWKWDDVVLDLGMRLCDIAHQDFLVWAGSVQDILAAKANGQLAWIPALESSTPIENELDRLDVLYGLGVRMMGIAYSEANALGSGLREPRDGGLTLFGRQAVRRMNQLGLCIDVSHSGDQTALDTIEVSDKPVVISHAGARALWPSSRLKPDEVIRACAAKGGIIGIEAAPHTTLTSDHPLHNLESVMQHVEYCISLVGIDHVTLGPDTLFGDHVGLHHAFAAQLSISSAQKGRSFTEVPFVDGMENPAEGLLNAARWLVTHGYSDEDCAKILGGNTLRVLREVWWT